MNPREFLEEIRQREGQREGGTERGRERRNREFLKALEERERTVRKRTVGERKKRAWREREKVHPIQLPSHEHPLVEYLGFFTDESSTKCHICSKLLVSSSLKDYVFHCPKCNYYFHWSCLVPFLQQINHPSHPHHLLTMEEYPELELWQRDYCFRECNLCGKSYFALDMPHFECRAARCNFNIDMICALSIPTVILENKNNDPPLCHRQRLVEINKHDEEDDQPLVKDCYICELPLSNSCHPAYSCTICHHFFHRSCTQLSGNIRHPFHLPHVLTLKLGGVDGKCNSCHKTQTRSNFIFRCCCCSYLHPYWMCVECAISRPTSRSTIIYQGHGHLLSLIEKEPQQENITCNSPYSFCKRSVVSNELTHTERYVICCQSCEYSLHFLCGPLPCVIKHNCHIHPLTLLDSMVEDNSGEYYCDACETQRDPRICVYYCAECKYMAHVTCVISEVVRVLQGDCRDVELRAVGQMNQKLKIESYEKEEKALIDLFTSLRKNVRAELKMLSVSDEEDNEVIRAALEISVSDEEDSVESWFERYVLIESDRNCLVQHHGRQKLHQIGETSIQELISDKNFEDLPQKLNNFDYGTRWSKVTMDELETKIVNVEGGYMIPWNLAHVLKGVLDKFGDISGDHDQNKSSTKELTNILYFYVCRLLYNMSRVMMVDITEDDLGDWYSCLEFLKRKGFKVDFIYSGHQQIVRAYIGLQARRAETAVKAKSDQTILNLRKEIEELQAKLKKELESNERMKQTSISETTIFMKQCLDEASQLEWKFAADCLDLMY